MKIFGGKVVVRLEGDTSATIDYKKVKIGEKVWFEKFSENGDSQGWEEGIVAEICEDTTFWVDEKGNVGGEE